MVIRWHEQVSGGVVDYPALLYRQLLSHSQLGGGYEGGHHSGMANIVRDNCPPEGIDTGGYYL